MKKVIKRKVEKGYEHYINGSKSYFLTSCNVMAWGKVKELLGGEYIQLLDLDKLTFKAINRDNNIEDVITYTGDMEKFRIPDNSCYSVRYLKMAKDLSLIAKGTKTLTIYGCYDVKKRLFIKDYRRGIQDALYFVLYEGQKLDKIKENFKVM